MQFEEEDAFLGYDPEYENGDAIGRFLGVDLWPHEGAKTVLSSAYGIFVSNDSDENIRFINKLRPDPCVTFVGMSGFQCIIEELIDKFEKYEQMFEEPEPRDISAIKKDIKHCKNPMERAKLERELTSAYIDKRNKRRASKASKKGGD